MSLKDDILEKVHALPPLPTSAVEVVAMMGDADVSIDRVRRVIERDPGLTVSVLRLANSAYFGGREHTATVHDAIVRLGLRRVLQLVVSTSLAPMAAQPVRGYDLPADALLHHCVATAVGAERLAVEIDIDAPEYTFTCGLLHDLGKIVLGTFLEVDPAPILKLAFEEEVPFQEAERRVLGMDHPEAGAVLLKAWNLPSSIVDVIRWHHEPEGYDGDDTTVLDLVHVADEIAMVSGLGEGFDGQNYVASRTVLDRLGVDTRVAERVMVSVLGSLDELSTLLGEGTGDDSDGS